MEVDQAATGTERKRFSLKAWAESKGFEARHVLALSGHEAKALSEAARNYEAADARVAEADQELDEARAAVEPFITKLKAIKAAAE